MSLSTHSPQDQTKLTHLPVSPIRPVPALEKKQASSAEGSPAKPTSTNTSPAESSTPKQTTPEVTPSPAKQPTKPGSKFRWQDALLDTLLVSLVVAVLAGGGYYIKTQRDIYRVPSLIEQANAQCEELCKQRERLQDDANRADEQIRMRRKLTSLEDKLRQFSEEAALRTAAISDQQNRVLALQHEIRRADKEARSVARGLMPGLYVGEVTTTRGKIYTEATISRLEGKRISLRTPYGAASLFINELVKDNLPDIALYALGLIDLVDMRDFSRDGSAPTTFLPPSNKLRRQQPADSKPAAAAPASDDYEPAPTGPVVDTASQIFE